MTTGGEVQWMAAGNLAKDPGGLRMLLSELPKFFLLVLVFLLIAWLIAPRFNATLDHIFQKTNLAFRQAYLYFRGRAQLNGYHQLDGASDKK